MSNDTFTTAGLVLMLLLSFWIGWAFAHNEVATECERQGSFYVGDTTYICDVKRHRNGQTGESR